MCKLTILHYVQCNCNPFDGNDGDGFIVTKAWHDRLLLDRDTVTHERCLQAKHAELNARRSKTLEFSSCRNTQVKNIRFEAEVCFRCLMHKRSKERADEIRGLLAEHKSFSARYATTRESAAKEAKLNEDLWQSIRASSQYGKQWADEMQRVFAERNVSGKADWEVRLESKIANRVKRAERQVQVGLRRSSAEEKELEKKKRARLAQIQLRLMQANTQVVSVVMEEDEIPLPESKEEEPAHRLRIARLAQSHSCGFGPRLDVMVSAQTLQSPREEPPFQSSSSPVKTPCPEISIAHPAILPGASETSVGIRATRPSAAIKIVDPNGHSSNSVSLRPVVESGSAQNSKTLFAKVFEYKPFKYPPPTEPRAMRGAGCGTCRNMSQTTGQPRRRFATARGYSTFRGWA